MEGQAFAEKFRGVMVCVLGSRLKGLAYTDHVRDA